MSPSLKASLINARIDDLHRSAPMRRNSSDDRRAYRFGLHYAEMVAVMFAGMFVLMAPLGWLFGVFGTSWSGLSPAMNDFAMAMTMTVPMIVWMRFRGHAWRPNAEMAASMLIPTFVVMGLISSGAAHGTLMIPEHAGMLACMLVAMLLRRDEYSCRMHGHRVGRRVLAV